MRLFVAVWPPEPVVELLAAIDRPVLEGVRWTPREQWHVTLRFLGEVDDAVVPDVERVVRSVAAGLSPARLVLGERVARFGRNVAHVEVDGLRAWGESFGAAFDEAGIGAPSDGRSYTGHVTIARAARRGGGVAAVTGTAVPAGVREWVATEVALVRSRLGSGGARYADLVVVSVG